MDLENKYGTLEIQKGLLVLLGEFDDFCRKEQIEYSLDSGSLLGAVRHKGFIPWDDDLDVVMNLENYTKLVCCMLEGGANTLVIERNTKDSLWVDRIRLRVEYGDGEHKPTLDVFIFDHVPNNKYLAKLKLLTLFVLQGMMKSNLSLKKGNGFQKVCT